MGDDAEYRLQQLHPEVFGSPYPRRRYYRPEPPRHDPRTFRIDKHVFRVGSDLSVYYERGPLIAEIDAKYSTRAITRQMGSRAFLKDYPAELMNPQNQSQLTPEEQAQFWLDWRVRSTP